MFDFFKKWRANPSEGQRGAGGPVISALLLAGDSFPVDAFLREVAEARFAGNPASSIEGGDGSGFSFAVDRPLKT